MKNCPTNSSRILFAAKTEMRMSCTIYKIPLNFSLSLKRKPGTDNPHKWYKKISVKQEKGNTSKDTTFFLKNVHRDEPFQAGFSIQMVSAQSHTGDRSTKLTVQFKEQHKRVFKSESERKKTNLFHHQNGYQKPLMALVCRCLCVSYSSL